jgi:hypothetical protein
MLRSYLGPLYPISDQVRSSIARISKVAPGHTQRHLRLRIVRPFVVDDVYDRVRSDGACLAGDEQRPFEIGEYRWTHVQVPVFAGTCRDPGIIGGMATTRVNVEACEDPIGDARVHERMSMSGACAKLATQVVCVMGFPEMPSEIWRQQD